MVFGTRNTFFNPVRFLLDESTGRLTQDGVTVCAFYSFKEKHARLTLCPRVFPERGATFLTCAPSFAPGTALQCSAVKLNCEETQQGNQVCTQSTESDWTKFYIGTGDYAWYLGPDDLGSPFTPVDVFVDYATRSADRK
jgi:hypothetical protein